MKRLIVMAILLPILFTHYAAHSNVVNFNSEPPQEYYLNLKLVSQHPCSREAISITGMARLQITINKLGALSQVVQRLETDECIGVGLYTGKIYMGYQSDETSSVILSQKERWTGQLIANFKMAGLDFKEAFVLRQEFIITSHNKNTIGLKGGVSKEICL